MAPRLTHSTGKEHERHCAAFQPAVDKFGYGKRKLPKDRAWGVVMHVLFKSMAVYVVEVSVDQGKPCVYRVIAGVHANRVVNPMGTEAQAQGVCIFGLVMTRPGFAIDIGNGTTKNNSFTDPPSVCMSDVPPMNVSFAPPEDSPVGLGEPGTPPIAPAVVNALSTLIDKRQHKLPFKTIQLLVVITV